MAQIIQMRRGTAAEWTAADPLLAEGEIGVEKDTFKWKVGDGLKVWHLLPYVTGAKGDKGDPGSPGPALNWRGAFSATTAYAKNDGVSYNGSSYLATAATTAGTLPPNAPWQVVAEKGATGNQGPKGDKGDQGIQGIQGIQGVKGDKGDTGTQGPPGTPLVVVSSLPDPASSVPGQMVLYNGNPWFFDGTTWKQVGVGTGGSKSFAFFMGDSD
jgi:hypothetical protein